MAYGLRKLAVDQGLQKSVDSDPLNDLSGCELVRLEPHPGNGQEHVHLAAWFPAGLICPVVELRDNSAGDSPQQAQISSFNVG